MILLIGFKGDSIETGISQRSSRTVDIQDCIVRVVRMDRVGGFYRKGSFLPFQAPRVGTVPVLISFPVGRGVFEVPVLNQFGIQAAIGGIVDVLKKIPISKSLISLVSSGCAVTVAFTGFKPAKRSLSCTGRSPYRELRY